MCWHSLEMRDVVALLEMHDVLVLLEVHDVLALLEVHDVLALPEILFVWLFGACLLSSADVQQGFRAAPALRVQGF